MLVSPLQGLRWLQPQLTVDVPRQVAFSDIHIDREVFHDP